jgi:hypothetical protein
MNMHKKILAPLFIVLNILTISSAQSFELSEYNHYSAAVLPTFTRRNIKWAILSREGYGKSKYLYDSFSGGKDKGETHPVQTAAHEFLQEAILEPILGWDLETAENFIDPNKENTWMALAYSKDKNPYNAQSRDIRNVLYIVNFNKYKTKLFNNFYYAREQELIRYERERTPSKYRTNTEKDRIAKVRWSELECAICDQQNSYDPVTVSAYVLNPDTEQFDKETITLRPILVKTLRAFFTGQPYEEGDNEKIRHYYE